MKIADIRVITADQPRCQIPLVEVETATGLIGIGATQAPVKPIAALIAAIAPHLTNVRRVIADFRSWHRRDAGNLMFNTALRCGSSICIPIPASGCG